MVVLDFSIVNVALPSLQRDLGFSPRPSPSPRTGQPELVSEVPEARHVGITVELSGETVDSRQALRRSDGQALGGGRLAQAIVEAGEARRRARELLHFECTGQMDGIKAPQGAALRELSGPPRHFRG